MKRPHVLLAFPHNGTVSIGAARGYNDGCYLTKFCDVTGMEAFGSFVPLAFNRTFHTALKARDYGGVTHYAMIHADIEPKMPRGEDFPSWIDVLYAEMEETGADVVSVVSPYKEPAHERTTVVVGDPDNPWNPKRHILLSDRSRLPETFGIEDCGDPATEFLQVNTGLMLVDLRRAYWDIAPEENSGDCFAFELMQRVIWRDRPLQDIANEVKALDQAIAAVEAKKHKGPDDYEQLRRLRATKPHDRERVVQSRSEDWEMSRHVWKHGGKCVATWKVPILHHGTFEWSNHTHPSMAETASDAPDLALVSS